MGLKARHDALPGEPPRRRQGGLDLGRVMSVVVVDAGAARAAAPGLEPPAGAREARETRRGLGDRETGLAASPFSTLWRPGTASSTSTPSRWKLAPSGSSSRRSGTRSPASMP